MGPAKKMKVICNAEIWERLLLASGGLLKFFKSSYFLLFWMFMESGKPRIVPDEDLPPNTVKETDANVSTATLTRVTKRKGIKMLGV
eukprot:10827927-Ditylum_brightwellii.AAC.1